jgi:hypothetical protein
VATKRVACPECSATVPYGRLSCPTCGTLLASVAGSTRRVSVRPNGRRPRGPSLAAVTAPALPATPEAGQDDAAPVATWPPRHQDNPEDRATPPEPAWPDRTAHETAEIFRTARLATSDPGHPTNGATPAEAVPDVLHDWVGPASSMAAGESASTRPRHAMRDFVAAAAGAVATLGRSAADATASAGDGRQIPGAYLAPSATRMVPVHAGSRIARPQRVASTPVVPGLNRWYSVPDGPADSPAAAMTAGRSPSGVPAQTGAARSDSSAAAPHPLIPGEAALRSDLPFAAPNGPSGWATAVGSGLAALAVVLPWAKNGVAGGQLSSGYLGQWGLANPAYLLLLAAGLAILLITILPNRLPRALREVAVPFLFGGFLIGLAWSYATGPFGTGLGVGTMLFGAGLLVTGGALGLRGLRRDPGTADTQA